ncbi:hypothetical protein F2Q69_00035116 [Brassica cretica]|uniref:Aspartic peptidase DDI1-type domain-containing protein n=1 Tax=Brassica cretica TaxID=69181 RepID=A0A8S9SSS4_BRACR|nr:hypothetical protein F2Q69_00035116 [Brassica cretica]
MPSSTRSNKETQLLFSPDPASLERSIRKEARSSSIDNTTCSSTDLCQPPSTQTLVPSTDTRLPLSTEDTHLPSTDIFHPTSINTSVRRSIDTEPRDMVATLTLVRDDRGNLHDQEGHLLVKEENLQEEDFEVESLMSFGGSHWCRSMPSNENRSIEVIQNRSTSSPGYRSTKPKESTTSCKAVRIMTHEEFAAKHPHPPSPVYMPKIDVARLNALRPKPKPSENPLETVRTPSDDGVDPMEVDRIPTGRTLRRRNEKVAKHLKRGANEKKKESFRKRVYMIPLDKPFDEAYFTHRLWMFFRETRETEEYIRRMFYEAREKMRMRITLKKKSDPGQFAIPCTVKGIEFPHALYDTRASVSILPRVMADHLGLQVEPSQELFTLIDCSQMNLRGIVRDLEVHIGKALVPVDFHVFDIKLNWNSSLLLGRAFLSIVGAVCNLQTNQLCLTLIDPNAHYDHIPVKKPQTTSRRINDPGIIAACHETEYSASIETHTATSMDSAHPKSTDAEGEESVDIRQGEWENDYYIPTMATQTMHTEDYDEYYEEERVIEQRTTLDEEDRLLHHSSWKKKSLSIERYGSTSIDTQPHQPNHLRALTDNAYFPSIDTNVDATRDGD